MNIRAFDVLISKENCVLIKGEKRFLKLCFNISVDGRNHVLEISFVLYTNKKMCFRLRKQKHYLKLCFGFVRGKKLSFNQARKIKYLYKKETYFLSLIPEL